jgi:prepilin peptidase CpaA
MPALPSTLLLAALALLLLAAAVGDIRRREIANGLNGAIALLAIPYWAAIGLTPWPEMAMQAGVALLVLGAFALLFHFGWMGGGDVKMIAALALWLPAREVLQLLVTMSLAGGALTIAMLIRARSARSSDTIEVPYGVAIAFGGFWVLAEPILNHFAR